MPDYTPIYSGRNVTLQASAAITGGQLVEVTGVRTVGPAGAGSVKWVGVAAYDAAIGDDVTIVGDFQIDELTASGTVTAGDNVVPAAAGVVASGAAAAGTQVGIALTTATTGNPVEILRVR